MEQPVDARKEFISILNNKDKELGSERGVLLLVGPERDLGILEQACFDTEQTWNTCITARYALKAAAPEMVFGTLLQQLIADVRGMTTDPVRITEAMNVKQSVERPSDKSYGKLREGNSGTSDRAPAWKNFSPLVEKLDFVLAVDNKKPIDGNKVVNVLQNLLSESHQGSLLEVGHRLVVFLQLVDTVEDSKAWSWYLKQIASILPYRTMLVISGLPGSVEIDTTVQTQRRLELKSTDGTPAPEQKVVAFKENAAISDEPSTDDRLNRRRYANALARMILHPQTLPPLSIGIHGPWGKGKSSFMDHIREELENESEESGSSVVTVTFNAWSYNDASQVWAGLLNKVSEAIEGKLGTLRTIQLNLGQVFKKRKAELLWTLTLPLFLFLAAVGLGKAFGADIIGLLKTALGLDTGSAHTEFEKAVIPLLGGFGSILFLFKRLATVMQPVSLRIAHFARLPNYSKELGFQHAVMDDLKFLNKSLQKRKANTRVVVCIDDLDRCSEQRIMEVLQAIILVLVPAKFFIILGIDTEMIYRAINQCYTTDGTSPPQWFARQYLKKILQLSFHLPSVEKTEREQLVASLFSQASIDEFTKKTGKETGGGEPSAPDKTLPNLIVSNDLLMEHDTPIEKHKGDVHEEWVEDTANELAAFLDYQECLEDNPREIKRAINVHKLMKFMMQKHGVQMGSWTEQRQRQLVRWVLFCTCWPELVASALREAGNKKGNDDVLKLCIDKHQAEIKSIDRRRRLSGCRRGIHVRRV
jgi:Cdc6-like AAA superfamily ATPase